MGILEAIISKKRERLAHSKSKIPFADIRAMSTDAEAPRDFTGAVRRGSGGIRLIAEIKKASPSKGLIRAGFDPAAIARIYQEKADAISVLTEEDFFKGDIGYIELVKGASERPVLRKDFLFDEYQIYESRAAGADAVLLIERALERPQAGEYLHIARELGMSVLFEVHDERGLEKALSVGADIIGVNNRDLDTLKIDINATSKLKGKIPREKIVVSESGIKNSEDIVRLEEAGVDAVLIGTAFMEAEDIGGKIDEIMGWKR
jgi:indole-3-glycerol phosphate synthase